MWSGTVLMSSTKLAGVSSSVASDRLMAVLKLAKMCAGMEGLRYCLKFDMFPE
ncbi:hypothetical protein Ptr902_12092 [Pyrenophora tritici-repentis]|nr:hypothetical protein Ptr902_12092 [Pyrenophora tritici-repentis]